MSFEIPSGAKLKPRDSAAAVQATNHFGRQMLLHLLTEVQHLDFLGGELSTPGDIGYALSRCTDLHIYIYIYICDCICVYVFERM